jgi:hypothetical protein
VTLFGNILQNPQDPRARSDVGLMRIVVNILSMLAGEDENTGVKRMLVICAELERIACVVLDKANRDTTTGRKRKELDELLPSLSVSRPPIARPAAESRNPPQFQGWCGDVNFCSGADSLGGAAAQDLNWMADTGFQDVATDFERLSHGTQQHPQYRAGRSAFLDTSRYLTVYPQNFQQLFVPPALW